MQRDFKLPTVCSHVMGIPLLMILLMGCGSDESSEGTSETPVEMGTSTPSNSSSDTGSASNTGASSGEGDTTGMSGGNGPTTFTFGVWFEEGCDASAMHTTFSIDTACPCYLVSYVSPGGETKTNAHYNYACGPEGVTFIQLTGTESCQSDPLPAGSRLIEADLTTQCQPVQTSNGLTYQKLIDYEPCSPTSDSIPASVPPECHAMP